MKGYQVNFYQSGRFTTSEVYTTLIEAKKEARQFVSDIRETCTTSRGYLKMGNLNKDYQLTVEHKAFGFIGGAYIKKRAYNRGLGWHLIEVNEQK